jgi:hypothetical protein
MRTASRTQDAIRLLMLLNAAAEPFETGGHVDDDTAVTSAVGVVRSQVRLQKLDFWVRNPDYLANELLNDYENGDGDPTLLGLADEILSSEEPELRTYPMLRWLFGAYEPLDDALAILASAGLIIRRIRGTLEHVNRHDYYLLQAGRELADSAAAEYEPLSWYAARSYLVVQLTRGQGATQLKDRQYLVDEYVNTPHGQTIPSIARRARERLATLQTSLTST